jgi:hypothetical protein
MAIELWPAILASVHTSQPLSPRRVKTVWRSPYSTKGRTPETFNVLACCFLRVRNPRCAGQNGKELRVMHGAVK